MRITVTDITPNNQHPDPIDDFRILYSYDHVAGYLSRNADSEYTKAVLDWLYNEIIHLNTNGTSKPLRINNGPDFVDLWKVEVENA